MPHTFLRPVCLHSSPVSQQSAGEELTESEINLPTMDTNFCIYGSDSRPAHSNKKTLPLQRNVFYHAQS